MISVCWQVWIYGIFEQKGKDQRVWVILGICLTTTTAIMEICYDTLHHHRLLAIILQTCQCWKRNVSWFTKHTLLEYFNTGYFNDRTSSKSHGLVVHEFRSLQDMRKKIKLPNASCPIHENSLSLQKIDWWNRVTSKMLYKIVYTLNIPCTHCISNQQEIRSYDWSMIKGQSLYRDMFTGSTLSIV